MLRVVLGGLQLPLPVAHRRAVRGQAFDIPGEKEVGRLPQHFRVLVRPLGLHTGRILDSDTDT